MSCQARLRGSVRRRIGEFIADSRISSTKIAHKLFAGAQNFEIFAICSAEFSEFIGDLIAFKPVRRCKRSSRMARACNSDRLYRPSTTTAPGLVNQVQSSAPHLQQANAAHKLARGVAGSGAADQRNHVVNIGDGDAETGQDMCARLGPCRVQRCVRRRMTSSRNARRQRNLLKVICCGRPSCSASMLTPKLVCSGVKRNKLIEHDFRHRHRV